MARKKKEKHQKPADYWTNPAYREEEERQKKLPADRPRFFLNLLMPLGALGGVLLGLFMNNLLLGALFGLVLGIMIGTQLDLRFPRSKGEQDKNQD